jgi:hypothetical protein
LDPHGQLQALPHLQAQNPLPKTQGFLPIRDGRDQVKFQPTSDKPTIFRARLGERPLWSVVNFGSAAVAVGHLEIGSTRFGPVAVTRE